MSATEHDARGWRLVREVDAYDLLSALLDEADREGYYSEEDRENARAELRVRQEDAAARLERFKREHGPSV